jgi:hypothetical protein
MKFPKPKKKKKKHLSKKIAKYNELFFYISVLWGCMCPIAESHGDWASPESLHHRLHNRKINRKRFPLFIDSVFNLVAVNDNFHMKYPGWGKFTVFEADKMELYIVEHKECLEIGYFKSKEELENVIEAICKRKK